MRDYIHVVDLARAHVKALDYISKHDENLKLNLGSETGISVKEMVEAARMLIQRNDIRVYILSAVEGEVAVREKEAWLLQHFGFDPLGCFFPRVGKSKAEYIKSFYGEITKDDFLIDDYSANLVDWENAGGTGLKLINEINGRGTNGTNFEGIRIDAHQTAEKIYADICAALNIQI